MDCFSIEISSYGMKPITVELPIFTDYKGDKTDRYQSYQIVIDKFTTQFKNENEFREYLKEKYPILKSKIFDVKMKYNGNDTFFGNTDLIFGNNGELVEFLKDAKIRDEFYTKDSIYIDAFIDGFKTEVMERMTTGDYKYEYSDFVTKNNFLYSKEMSDILKIWEENKDNYILDLKNPFRKYKNIRGHCLSHYIDLTLRLRENNHIYFQDEDRYELEKEQKEIKEKIESEKQDMFFQEEDRPLNRRTVGYSILYRAISPCDTNRDFFNLENEVLDEMREKYDLKEYDGFTIDPEEEMERLNNHYDDNPKTR